MIVVAAHPDRAVAAELLADEVGARIVWEDGAGQHDTMARAWELAGSEGPFATVIEDDAVPCPAFHTQVLQAHHHAPAGAFIGLYLGVNYPPIWQPHVIDALRRADEEDAAFIASPMMLHGVGITVPAAHAVGLSQWVRTAFGSATDLAVGTYATYIGNPIVFPSWSLVDHADLPSLVAHPDGVPRTLPRHAHRFGAPDWNTRLVTL